VDEKYPLVLITELYLEINPCPLLNKKLCYASWCLF